VDARVEHDALDALAPRDVRLPQGAVVVSVPEYKGNDPYVACREGAAVANVIDSLSWNSGSGSVRTFVRSVWCGWGGEKEGFAGYSVGSA